MPCPEFEYEHVPNHRRILSAEVEALLIELRGGKIDTLAGARDTRPFHRQIFATLTPQSTPYYAGNYRGDQFPCLKDYAVKVPSDPRVGCPPSTTPQTMNAFAWKLQKAVQILDQNRNLNVTAAEKINCVVVVSCRLLEEFLRIHPYANGNGHIGRLLIWFLLGRYGYWPSFWTVEPRPPDPPYTDLIVQARNGNHRPLEDFVLGCIGG